MHNDEAWWFNLLTVSLKWLQLHDQPFTSVGLIFLHEWQQFKGCSSLRVIVFEKKLHWPEAVWDRLMIIIWASHKNLNDLRNELFSLLKHHLLMAALSKCSFEYAQNYWSLKTLRRQKHFKLLDEQVPYLQLAEKSRKLLRTLSDHRSNLVPETLW